MGSDPKDYKGGDDIALVGTDGQERDVESSSVERTLTLFGGTAFIIGCMIGSGIFATGGAILNDVGSPGMAILVWVFGAVVSLAGGFSYAEWGLMVPASGGDTPYLEYVYRHPKQLASFIYCWCRSLLIQPAYTAALATVTSKYFWYAVNSKAPEEWPNKGVALLVMVLTFGVIGFSNKVATQAISIITTIKLLGIGFVLLTGAIVASGAIKIDDKPANFTNAFAGSATDLSKYANAMYTVLYCYDGWAYLSTCIGELQNPRRNVPLAVIGGVSIVSVLYLLANMAYMVVLPADVLRVQGETLAAEFVKRVYSAAVAQFALAPMIAVTVFGTCLAITFGSVRVVQEAGKRSFLPMSTYLKQNHPQFGTPLMALSAHMVLSAIILVAVPAKGAFGFLLNTAGYPVWVFYTLTVAGLFLVRKREPEKSSQFRAFILCPVVVVLAGLFLMVFPFLGAGWLAALIGLVVMGTGALAYYPLVYKRAAKFSE